MPRHKLSKIKELQTLNNVLQPKKESLIEWQQTFGNNKPLILELACGKGDYSLALAQMHSNKNFIGIDIKGVRLWHGAKIAQGKNLDNVKFLRINIENLDKYFKAKSVEEVWITFPDPFPKKRQFKHRLTSPKFLEMHKKILKPKGVINLKTDDLDFFNYSIETAILENFKIKEIINNIYAPSSLSFLRKKESRNKINEIADIKTFYEKKHLKNNKQIHYLKIKK